MKQLSKGIIMKQVFLCGLLLSIIIVVVNGQGYLPRRPPSNPICSLPREPGPCRGSCPRYYYDTRRGTCRSFTYGCCGGNANNFQTRQLCNRICNTKVCPEIACLVGACTFQTCPAYPQATCFAVCPCTSVWIYDGEDVSNRCFSRG
ncbi:PI-stichotoxin-Hcr2i-like isoform X1 [Saccostrea cucullata]|uniref:PI-stichotoxin-Hcr2i-like isoform X1 n=1 Tax=Saccostrea cuccullata TaxID=36930 RepID=UPI002ED242FF